MLRRLRLRAQNAAPYGTKLRMTADAQWPSHGLCERISGPLLGHYPPHRLLEEQLSHTRCCFPRTGPRCALSNNGYHVVQASAATCRYA